MSPRARRELGSAMSFVEPDIEQLSATVRRSNAIEYINGVVLAGQAEQRGNAGKEFARLYTIAASSFRSALRANPDDVRTVLAWGRMEHVRARLLR